MAPEKKAGPSGDGDGSETLAESIYRCVYECMSIRDEFLCIETLILMRSKPSEFIEDSDTHLMGKSHDKKVRDWLVDYCQVG